LREHYAQLLTVIADEPDLANANLLVDAKILGYPATSSSLQNIYYEADSLRLGRWSSARG
jgi:hypothetical protein